MVMRTNENVKEEGVKGIKWQMDSMLKGWTKFELTWLSVFTALGIFVWVVTDDNGLGFLATITGMVCNLLVAKGKIANYYFGIVNVIIYGWLAYTSGLYGETMLNWGFYLIANIVGIFLWNKNTKKEQEVVNGEDVETKSLTLKGWATVVVVFVVGAVLYGILLTKIASQEVHLDSMAVVLSVIAQVLLVKRYRENWVLWILVNVITIALWIRVSITTGEGQYAMLVMWVAYLVNAIYGYVNWLRITKKEQ